MGKGRWWLNARGALLLALLGVAQGSDLAAQTTDPNTPASSPLWWTLTDELSPRELRQTFRDRKGQLQLYREALEKGEAAPHPPEQLEYLSYFHSGALHPELLPMWEAFDAFALRLRYHDGWDAKASGELARYGITEPGRQVIIEHAYEALAREDHLRAEIGDDQRAFIALARQAAEVLGDQAVEVAMKKRQADVIAQASKQPPGRVRELMSAWEIDPAAATEEELLPELKEALAGEDWQKLREYLLREVAPGTSAIDFDDSERIP